VVLDLMIHDIDLALDLTGQEPTSMTAFGLTAHNGAIDHAVVHLGFGSGPMVTLTASRVTEQKIRSIEVTALDAYVEADLLNKSISVHRRTTAEYLAHNQRGIKYRQESILEGIHVPSQEPLFSELQHFVDCVLDKEPPVVSAADGLRALRLASEIRAAVSPLMGVARCGRLQRMTFARPDSLRRPRSSNASSVVIPFYNETGSVEKVRSSCCPSSALGAPVRWSSSW
jgi:predicted dehydrogenase